VSKESSKKGAKEGAGGSPAPSALILPYRSREEGTEVFPVIHPEAWIAPMTVVTGDVHIGELSSIWYGTVIRGDLESVRIGARTNIQDLSVIHVDSGGFCVLIGDEVTVGHAAKIHGCTIRDRALIGIGAILLNGCEIGEGAFVAAGSLVPPGKKIPPGMMAMGSPAKVVREVTDAERKEVLEGVQHYVEYSQNYRFGRTPGSTPE
jgi:carbonic anhydrase/acetyltransferase-like protein (isoleucine patch superfamily)